MSAKKAHSKVHVPPQLEVCLPIFYMQNDIFPNMVDIFNEREDLAFSSPYCKPNFFTSLNDLHCTFQVHIWRNEATSYIRYHAIFLRSLYGEREKRALEAFLVSFPTVRDQKPTTGILVSVSNKKKKRRKPTAVKFTVPECFELQPREPAYFTYDSGMNSLKFKLLAARSFRSRLRDFHRAQAERDGRLPA